MCRRFVTDKKHIDYCPPCRKKRREEEKLRRAERNEAWGGHLLEGLLQDYAI